MDQRSDAELISGCLEGDGLAWEDLVKRYKRLVFSIPLKWGLDRDDAMEIFQAVWLDCFRELHLLRDLERLQAWLVRIAVRKCYRYREKSRAQPTEIEIMETDQMTDDPSEELVRRLDQEQMLRIGI